MIFLIGFGWQCIRVLVGSALGFRQQYGLHCLKRVFVVIRCIDELDYVYIDIIYIQ